MLPDSIQNRQDEYHSSGTIWDCLRGRLREIHVPGVETYLQQLVEDISYDVTSIPLTDLHEDFQAYQRHIKHHLVDWDEFVTMLGYNYVDENQAICRVYPFKGEFHGHYDLHLWSPEVSGFMRKLEPEPEPEPEPVPEPEPEPEPVPVKYDELDELSISEQQQMYLRTIKKIDIMCELNGKTTQINNPTDIPPTTHWVATWWTYC